MSPSSLGLHIMDPRILSDQVGDDADGDHHHHHLHSILPSPSPPLTVSLSAPPRTPSRPSAMSSSSSSSSLSQDTDNLYSNLATFTFGEARAYSSSYDSDDEGLNAISPLTSINRPGADRTPRPSVSASTSTSPKQISSHPSQGPGRQASNPFPSSSRSSRRGIKHTDEESSEVPSQDLITRHGYPRRSNIVPDNASQTTFGHLPVRSSIAFSSYSRSSSRASSHDGLEFSSDDEVEIYYDGGSSPVTFARDLDDIDEDAPAFHRPLFETRRGSFPMPIPGTSSDALSNRSREGSILTIRRPSRSLDDDLASHLSSHSGEDPATVVPRSEPLTRADFRSLEVLATQQQLDNPPSDRGGAYDGFDLAYVLSRGSEGSIRSFRSTAQPSFMSPGRTSTSDPSSSSRLSSTWGRRTSTVTLHTTGSGGGEDSFLRHVGLYGSRSDQWSFLKEKADGPSASGISSARHGRSSSLVPPPIVVDKVKQIMLPGAQEIWRSGHVGRYKVDRLAFKPATADPTKAAQQRINVRHIQDPFINLKGTKPGGPSSVIHKHSRAIAFSIFRSYTLFQSKRGGTMSLQSGSRNIHMHTSGGIMLAPKKVQEQYTSTKTTSKLSTHGLLEDGSRKPTGSADKSRRGKEKEVAKKSKAKDKKKDKDKKNERGSYPTESTESSATSSTGSITPSGTSHIMSAPVRATPSKITFAPSTKMIVKLQPASGPSSPETSTPDHSAKKPLESDDSSPVSVVSHNLGHRGSIDSDERLPTRTPHAEAFGTLDPNDIEHLRRAQKPSDGSSSFYRIFKRFRPVSSRPDSNSSLPAVTPQNAYSPPWIVTAGRDQNEESVRVLTDLNNSFRDVGLLHTQPHKTGFKSTSKKRTGHDIFDYVPEDSLYMLLPLWAGETDSTNSPTQSPTLPTVPEDRQYLLVWYVPFENDKGKKPEQQQQTSTKKKVKQSNSNPDSTCDTNQKNVYVTHFRVNARLVGYDDLRGSGIRLPSDGLAVTAPAWEAVSYNNVDAAQSVMQMSETTICVCSSREKGFQFQPEGLTKLGLCSHEEVVVPPVLPLQPHMYEYEQGGEVEPYLTPIGRAAVEMVWLGCLAITSFGPA